MTSEDFLGCLGMFTAHLLPKEEKMVKGIDQNQKILIITKEPNIDS